MKGFGGWPVELLGGRGLEGLWSGLLDLVRRFLGGCSVLARQLVKSGLARGCSRDTLLAVRGLSLGA